MSEDKVENRRPEAPGMEVITQKIGLRLWRILLVEDEGIELLEDLVEQYSADLAFLVAVDESSLTDLLLSFRQISEWSHGVFPIDRKTPEKGVEREGIGIFIGPSPKIDRISSQLALQRLNLEAPKTATQFVKGFVTSDFESWVKDHPLPEIADIPKFRLEGMVDPLGQKQPLVARAIRRLHRAVEKAAGSREGIEGHAESVEERGDLILPSLADIQHSVSLFAKRRGEDEGEERRLTADLLRLTRGLLTHRAGGEKDGRMQDVASLADALEEISFLMVVAPCDPETPTLGGLNFELGHLIACAHEGKLIHGDLKLENILVNLRGSDPLEVDMSISDLDTCCLLESKPTALERARDLGFLKYEMRCIDWEYFKAGYRSVVGELADEVFAEI